MQNVDQNINLIPQDVGLIDLLNYYKKMIKQEFNCHHIGTIQSFDPSNQTAQVTINYMKTFQQQNDIGNVVITTSNYPILIDCPVICLGGGGASLTFPITSGDECLVFFNDRDFDVWFSGSSSSAPATPRLHGFSDAIILVGVRSLPNVISSYPQGTALTYDGSQIQITQNAVNINYGNFTIVLDGSSLTINLDDGIELVLKPDGTASVTNESGELLNTLDNLFTDISTGTVPTLLGPQLLVMPNFAAHFAIFETFLT